MAEQEGTPTPRTLGQTLSAERERQGLSRADVAQRLHMSAYQVEAIENGDLTRLPQGTFLRGFVRNYAKVLGMAPDGLLALLGEASAGPRRPGIVVPDMSIRFDPAGERLNNPYVKATGIAFVVIALGFAAMYWWLFVRPSPPATTVQRPAPAADTPAPAATPAKSAVSSAPVFVPPPAVAQPASPSPAPAPSASTPPATTKAAAVVAAAPVVAAPAKANAASAPAANPVTANVPSTSAAADPKKSGEPTLKFKFKGESWVEVRDARGRLLFSRLNPAGSDTEVSGKPPFNVIVGNAPEVQVFYNDRAFDLEPHTKVAVARFTVE